MQLRSIETIDTVACVGAGTIGGGWAAYFLSRGLRVRVWDPSPVAGEKLARLIDTAWPALTRLGLAEGEEGIPHWQWLEAPRVVTESLRDVTRGRAVSVPSRRYRAIFTAAQLVPTGLMSRLAARGR